jgi:transglutaminase-like putative cysteine protease
VLNIAVACLLALPLPVALKLVFGAPLAWPWLTGLLAAKLSLSVAACRGSGRLRLLFTGLSALYSLVLGLFVLAGVLITPYSAYEIWFQALRDGTARGAVSTLFVLLAVLFCGSAASVSLEQGWFAGLYLEALAAAGLLSLAYRSTGLQILLVLLLASGAAYWSLRRLAREDRRRSLGNLVLLLAPACGAALLLWAVVQPRGSRLVDQRLHPGLRQAIVAVFPRFPLLYGIPGFGIGYSEKRLGGVPALSEAPFLEVEGRPGERLYLRAGSYDTYDGRSWSKSASPPPRPAQDPVLSPLGSTPPAGATRLTLLAEYYFSPLYTLDTQSLLLPPGLLEKAGGSFSSGYLFELPWKHGQSLYLQRGEPAATPQPEDGPLSRYLQTPAHSSARLRQLARQLADPNGQPWVTLQNIEAFLASGYAYNLQVGQASSAQDFVEHFLFQEKQGYCVHFASAFVLLARLAGIPARYATGFLAWIPAGAQGHAGAARVSGLSAHAWPEVWIASETGGHWTTWEATGALNPAYYREIDGAWMYEHESRQNRLTLRQLSAILGRQPRTSARMHVRSFHPPWRILSWAAAIGLALLLLALIRRRAAALCGSIWPTQESALRLLRALARSAAGRRAGAPSVLGWVRWTTRLAEEQPRIGRHASRLRALLLRLAYSSHGMSRRDMRFLIGCYRRCMR